ncbi:antiviral reverse transcriptase Drt3a [Shewanella algae]|uniref:antiviral reverse transcriptase Drt3a n=1 Tax=Shewanella algae TaxID=38313 RepID=UPI00277B4AFA|nr:antiviral reverse transcriptase Drt3a [Shewanella algae]
MYQKKISNKNFRFEVKKSKHKIKNKDVYSTGNSVESYFAEKQMQYNIKCACIVKQADRDMIVPQLKSILSDDFPKIIIKTDIKSFYESLNHKLLLEKLKKSNELSLTTRKIISRMLISYKQESSLDKGIPRGIGVSAYLAELYMKRFDSVVSKIENLIYYSRYVDDIILVVGRKSENDINDIYNLLESELKKESLEINKDPVKTKKIEYVFKHKKNERIEYDFDFLGYKFKFKSNSISLHLSDKKTNNYINKIRTAIDCYNRSCIRTPNVARKQLFLRLKFITCNTKLFNNKKNASVGIYSSNKWLSDLSSLSNLDNILMGLIQLISNPNLRSKLTKFSFKKGFEERRYVKFSPADFHAITKVWI